MRTSSGSRLIARVVGFALLMDYLVYGLLIPLTPYFPDYSTDDPGSGLIYAAYSTGVLFATPLFGYMGDRIGYRRPMIYGVALATIALALFYAAPNFYVVLAGRLFHRAATAGSSWSILA
jgi:MFS family permease